MKRICALPLLLLAFVSTHSQQQQPAWQWSERPSVRLSVRDKYGDLGGYGATFVVTQGPSGRRYEKTVRVEGDHFGSVEFPGDFEVTDHSHRGKTYHWKCLVGGKVVAQGRFRLATTHDLEPEERPRRPARRRRD